MRVAQWMRRRLPGALAAVTLVASNPGFAAPEGGVISAGLGAIERPAAGRVVVRQESSSMVADWRSFDVDQGESVRFDQPGASAAVLNRIHDADPSRIMGTVSANGRVFLANPNGMIFGQTAVVDVGALVATTLSIDDERFMRGEYRFDRGGSGSIVNRGVLRAADGGSISLIADAVRNDGLIVANLGQVHLAAGGSAVLDFDGDGLIGFEVGAGEVADALSEAHNSGRIESFGGQVLMTAKTANQVISSVVNNDGMISADSVVSDGGRIRLVGDDRVENAGALSARGARLGGTIDVLGEEVVVRGRGRLDASGAAGGGTIHVGGSYQGGGPLPNARNTVIEAGATLRADATVRGDGGKVIVWADDATRVDGRISARGGPLGGDGGFVETSGRRVLDFSVPVDVSAPAGTGGTWLLDPEDIVIDNAKAGSIVATLNEGGNVSVKTSAEGEGEGNITVAAAIEKTAGDDAALTLDAHNRIDVDAPITSTSGKLDVNLLAGRKININNTIDTNAGNLSARITGAAQAASDASGPETTSDGASAVVDQGSADDAPFADTPTGPDDDSGLQAGSVADGPNDDAPAGEQDVLEGIAANAMGNDTTASPSAPGPVAAVDGQGDVASTGSAGDVSLVPDESATLLDMAPVYDADVGVVVADPVTGGDAGIDMRGAIRARGSAVELAGGDGTAHVSGVIDVSDETGAGGSVRITADDIVFEGATIDASGENAGSVDIGADANGRPSAETGASVVIDEDSEIRADARGSGDGGRVAVWSNDVTSYRGAISASGGPAGGDGGFVEVSSKQRVNLHGGVFDVSAPNGAAGTVLIDPVTLDVTTDQFMPGGNLVLQADERITVADGVVISTRDIGAGTDHLNDASVGDSGDLTLTSPLIEVGDGAQLLAFADNGFASGDILLEAVIANDPLAVTDDGVVEIVAGISVDGSVIRGGRVELLANAQSTVVYDDTTTYTGGGQYADVTARLGARLGHGFQDDPVFGGVSVASAAATIDILGSQLIADSDIFVSANALASATVQTHDEALSLAYGESSTLATVTVAEGSALHAGNDATLEATTTNVTTSATNALSSQVFRPVTNPSNKALVTLAVADTNATTIASVDDDSSIDAGGTAAVGARNTKTVATLSAANAFRNGTLGQSTALSFADVFTQARVDGMVTAADLDVIANSTTVSSNTGALAGFKGVAATKQAYQDVSGQLNAFFIDQTLQHALGISLDTAIPDVGSLFSDAYDDLSQGFHDNFGATLPDTATFEEQVVNPVTQEIEDRVYRALVWELPGSSAFSDHVNETNAIVGANAVIKVDNDVDINATMLDDGVQNFSHSAVQLYDSAYYPTNPNQQRDVTSVALLATIHDNDANAIIEGGAVVDAGGALNVEARTELPNDGIIWPDTSPIDEAAEKLSAIDLSLRNLSDAKAQLGGIFDDFKQDLRDEGDILAGLVTTSAKARAGTRNRRFGSADAIGIAGSANLIKIDNHAVAGIGDGAQINQDPAFRGGGQNVTVSADAALDTVNLSGNIGVIPPPEDTGITGGDPSNKGKFLGVDKASRDTNGAGSSLLGLRMGNGAVAEIGSGVALYADELVVDATSNISNISASVASGTGERYGIKGSFLGSDIRVDATAKIDDGAIIEANGVGVNAAGIMPRNLNVAVGEINERSPVSSSGVRPDDRWAAAVVDNRLARNVDAFIGNRDGESIDAGSVNAGAVNLSVSNSGVIEGYSLAVDRTTGPTVFGNKPPAQNMNYNNRYAFRQGRGTHFGIRASIDVSRNTIEDDSSVYINGGTAVTSSEGIHLDAQSANEISAFAGAATLMSDHTGTNSQRGIAGAYAENTIGANTAAYVEQAHILSTPMLELDAITHSTISGIAAGGAISNATDAIVGSVVYNAIGNAPDPLGQAPAMPDFGTLAYLSETEIGADTLVRVNASETSVIDAIAGAFAKSNRGGYGGAFAINAVGNRVDSWIVDSRVETPGALSLTAVSDAMIESFAAAIAKGGEDAYVGAMGWNDILNDTAASIFGSAPGNTEIEAGSLSLSAVDTSLIDSKVGAFGDAGNQGIGVSAAFNDIDNSIRAGIDGATANSDDDLVVHAESTAEIRTLAGGYTESEGDGLSASYADNDIVTTVDAFITGGAVVETGAGGVSLGATTDNFVELLAATIAATGNSSGGSGGSVGGGSSAYRNGGGTYYGLGISGDVAFNNIFDMVTARIDGDSVVTSGGDVSLSTLNESDIDNFTGAIEKTNDPNGTGIAGAYSDNTIGGAALASIASATVTAGGNVHLTADRAGDIFGIAIGIATGGALDLAGSVSNNTINTATGAALDGAVVNAANVRLAATDESGIFSIGGAAVNQGGSNAQNARGRSIRGGVGAGIAINDIGNITRAVIDNSQVETGAVDLVATTTGQIQSIAGAVANGSANMLGGALSWNEIGNTTEALIRNGLGARTVHAGSAVTLQAADTSTIESLAGQITRTDSSAIGASVAYNQVGNVVDSRIDNARVVSDGTLTLDADTTSNIATLVGGLVIAGADNISASLAINDITTATVSRIGAGADVDAAGAVLLDADATADIDVLSFSIASGAPDNGGGSSGGSVASNPSGASGRNGTNFGVNISADVVLNSIATQTAARVVGGATVDTLDAVTLDADSTSDIEAFAGAVQLAGNPNVSAAGAYVRSDIADLTEALVDGAAVGAGGPLSLQASHGGGITGIAVGGAKGGKFNLAGSVSHNVIGNDTRAAIDAATVTGQSTINLGAVDDFDIVAVGGAVSFGGVNAGLGAGIALNDVASETTAAITGSDVFAGDQLALDAQTTGDIWSVSAAVSRGDNALAGTVSINTVDNVTNAVVANNVDTVLADTVTIKAANDAGIHALAGSVGLGGNLGIGGAAAYNRIGNQTFASIDNDMVNVPGGVSVLAENDAFIETLVGGVAIAGTEAISVSVALNEIMSLTQASITDGALVFAGGPVLVDADSDSDIDALAVSATVTGVNVGGGSTGNSSGQGGTQQSSSQGGFGVGISGDVVLNTIADTTTAFIDAASQVTTPDLVHVTATNASDIDAIAGALNLAVGSSGAGLAGAYVQNDIGGDTSAYVDNAVLDAGDVYIGAARNNLATKRGGQPVPDGSAAADTTDGIFAIAAGGTFGGQGGIAGSVANSLVTGTTRAFVQNASVIADGNVVVEAVDDADIFGIGGAVAVSSLGGFGPGLSINRIEGETVAGIYDGAVDAGGEVRVKAERLADVSAIAGAIGVSHGNGLGVAGSFSFNRIDSQTRAEIAGGSGLLAVEAVEDVVVHATDDSSIHSLSGAIGFGSVAIGMSAAYNEIANMTSAGIVDAEVSSTDGSVVVDSDSSSFTETLVAGIGASTSVAASGSAAVTRYESVTDAFISDAVISADDNVLVLADADNEVDALAAGLQASTSVGLGGAVIVNVFDNATSARIDEGALVNARANGDAAVVNTGALDSTTTTNNGAVLASKAAIDAPRTPGEVELNDTVADDARANTYELNKALGGRVTEQVKGVAVAAVSTDDVETIGVNASGAGTAGVAAAPTVNILGATVTSTIDDASVNQDKTNIDDAQAVRVNAGNHSVANTYGGGGGAGGSAGVGAALGMSLSEKTTIAAITGSDVDAAGGVDVNARASGEYSALSIGLGLGGAAGIAGSAGVVTTDNMTRAYIDNANVNAFGDIGIGASDVTNIDLLSGGIAGAGTAAVGVAANVVVARSHTDAFIAGESRVNAMGYLDVEARNDVDLFDIAAAGTLAGTVGVSAGVGVKVIENTAEAYITGASEINQDAAYDGAAQDVSVTAIDDLDVFGVDAALGIGGTAGVGAGVDLVVANNTANAYIDDGIVVDAGRDIAVLADTSKEVVSISVGLGAAGKVGAGGAASVVVIGGAIDGDGAAAIDLVRNGTTGEVDDPNTPQDESQVPVAEADKENYDVNDLDAHFVGNPLVDMNGNSLLVANPGSPTTTRDQFAQTLATRVENSTNGLSVIEYFAEGTTVPDAGTNAWIGVGATVDAGRDVNVSAVNTVDLDIVSGGVGVGAFAGIGGGVGIGLVTDSTNAWIGGLTTIDAGRDVNVTAFDGHELVADPSGPLVARESQVIGAAGGAGIVGLGAAVAVQNRTSTTRAYLDSNAWVNNARDVNVTSQQVHRLRSDVVNVGIGGVAGGGSYSQARSTGDAAAYLGVGAKIGDTDDPQKRVDNLRLIADADLDADAHTVGITGGLVGGTGSGTNAQTNTDVDAFIGMSSVVDVEEDVLVEATSDSTSTAAVESGSGGVISVNVNLTDARSFTRVDAGVLDSAKVFARDLTLRAEEIGAVTADAQSAGGALLSVQGAGAYAGADSGITAVLADAAEAVLERDALVLADSELEVYSEATAAGGGAVSINGNGAEAKSVSGVTARAGGDVKADTLSVVANAANADGDPNHRVRANASSAGGGLVSVNAGGAVADGTSTIVAAIADDAVVETFGAANVTGRAVQLVEVDVTSPGGGGISVNQGAGTTTSTVNLDTRVGKRANVDAASLKLEALALNEANPGDVVTDDSATSEPTARAEGGGISSTNVAGATATATSTVNAIIDDDAVIDVDGKVDVLANVEQSAAAALLAAGGGIISTNITTGKATSNLTARARIGKRVDIDAGSLLVDATTDNLARSGMAAAGGGIISVNGGGVQAIATTDADALIDEAIGSDAVIDVTGDARVLAGATQSAEIYLTAPGGGAISVNAGDASTTSTVNADATIGGEVEVEADNLTVQSTATNDANPGDGENDPTVRAEGGGAISVNVASAGVTATTTANAVIGPSAQVSVDNALEVKSDATQQAHIAALNAGGGAVSVNVGSVSATSNVTSLAKIGTGVNFDPVSVLVDAQGNNTFTANTKTTGGGAISVNVGGNTATGTMNVDAVIDDDAVADDPGADVTISARGEQSGKVTGDSRGGGLIDVSTAAADVDSTLHVNSRLGKRVDLDIGSLDMDAFAENIAEAETFVFNGGFIAVGSAKVESTTTTSSTALIDDEAKVTTAEDIDMTALGRHRAKVHSEAESGGFVAVNSGDVAGNVLASGDIEVSAGTGSDVVLRTRDLSIFAGVNVDANGNGLSTDADAGYGVFSDGFVQAGGFIGVSGATFKASSTPDVFAGLGANNDVIARNVDIDAVQQAYASATTESGADGFIAAGAVSTDASIGIFGVTYPQSTITQLRPYFTENFQTVYMPDPDPGDLEFYFPADDLDGNYPQYRTAKGGYVPHTDDEGRVLPVVEQFIFLNEKVGYTTVSVDVGDGLEDAAVLVDENGMVIGVDTTSGAFQAERNANDHVVLVLDGDDNPVPLGGDAPGLLVIDDTIDNGSRVEIEADPTLRFELSLVPVYTEEQVVVYDYSNPDYTAISGRVEAAIGDNTSVFATGEISVDADGTADSVSDARGSGHGFSAGYGARSRAFVANDIIANIGDGASLVAQSQDGGSADVTITATRKTSADAIARATAGAFTVPHLIPAATSFIASSVDTTVGDGAHISADNVTLKSESDYLLASADSMATVGSFDTAIWVDAYTTVAAPVAVTVKENATITGRNKVTLAANLLDVADGKDGKVTAFSHKAGDAAFDTGFQYAETKSDLDAFVDFRDTAEIHTLDVDFQARLDSNTEVNAKTTTNSALIDPNTGYNSSADAQVHWDGTVFMLDSVGQELLIHPDGRIETLLGEITASYDALGNIIVGDLVKDEIGRVRVVAEKPGYSYNFLDGVGPSATHEEYSGVENPNGFIIDRGELVYSNVYPYVKIVNESDNDLYLGKIILASPDSALPEFVVSAENIERDSFPDWSAERSGIVNWFNRVTDADGFTNDPSVLFGDQNPLGVVAPNLLTITEADGPRSINIFGETGADVIFTDIVDSEENVAGIPGSVYVSNEAGRILSEGNVARIETHLFDAQAFGNGIGTAGDPIDVRLWPDGAQPGSLGAFADGDIFLRTRLFDRGALVVPTLPEPTEIPGTVEIRDVTSSSDIHLDLVYDADFSLCCTSQFVIKGTVQALDSVNITVDDDARLDIDGIVMAGVENYVVDIDAGGNVSLDLTNVDISTPRLLADGSTVLVDYTDAEWFGFETAIVGNTIVLPDIVHRPGAIDIQGAEPASDWLTGDGSLRVLDGYSHVTVNNDSNFDLELHTIDIDQAETASVQVNADTDVQTDEYDDIDVSTFGNAAGLIKVNASQSTDVVLAEQLLNSSGLTDIGIDSAAGGDIRQLGNTQLIRARDIDLVAEGGGIGSVAAPIRTDLTGGDLYARSQGDIHIHEILGDLHLESALAFGPFAGPPSDVFLTAQQSITDANGAPMNIYGHDVELAAQLGSIDTDVYASGAVSAYATLGSIDLDSVLTVLNSTVFADIAFREVIALADLDVDAAAISDVSGSTFDVGGHARFNAVSGDIILGDDPADVVNFGSLTFTGGDVYISEDSGMHLVGDSFGIAGDLLSAGSITEASSVVFDDVANLFAVDDIVLDSAENDFRSTVNSTAVNITLVDANSIELGTTNAAGALNVTALDGTITDVGPASVAGTTTLVATGDIVLDTPANDFMGPVHSNGANTTLVDANDILLGTNAANGDFDVTALGGSITQVPTSAGATVAGVTRLVATEEITMDNTANDFMGPVNARNSALPHDGVVGSNIYLYDSTAIELDEIIAGANLTVAAVGDITDSIGSLIDAPYRANLFSLANIALGDDPTDAVNFGHYGVDALGTDQYGLQLSGDAVAITEKSATNFFGVSEADSLVMNTFGDMTDTGRVTVRGDSRLKVTKGDSIYLDTKTSAYHGDVTFDTVSGTGRINNIRFIDSSDLLLHPLTVDGFLDIAALYRLRTSDRGAVRSLGGDISLNGYNVLEVGEGGVVGPGAVNLAAADGGFGLRPSQAGRSDLFLNGDVRSTGGKVSLLAGDSIIDGGGIVYAPGHASFLARRGAVGSPFSPIRIDINGIATLFQPDEYGSVAGRYQAVTKVLHGSAQPDVSPFFDDVFFRGLPTVPPDPEIEIRHDCDANPGLCPDVTLQNCLRNPAACPFVIRVPGCEDNLESCVPVTIVDCLVSPEACYLVPCNGDPENCKFTHWFEKYTGRPFTPIRGNSVARHDESPYEITVCNGVNLFGQNEECNPVNEEIEIFEIREPLYSTDRL